MYVIAELRLLQCLQNEKLQGLKNKPHGYAEEDHIHHQTTSKSIITKVVMNFQVTPLSLQSRKITLHWRFTEGRSQVYFRGNGVGVGVGG